MYLKMSTRSIYGLRALIDLGLHAETETVSLQSIASRQNISINYLEQIMPLLKKAGLITSSRGAQGGYRLGRPADEISVGDEVEVCASDTVLHLIRLEERNFYEIIGRKLSSYS